MKVDRFLDSNDPWIFTTDELKWSPSRFDDVSEEQETELILSAHRLIFETCKTCSCGPFVIGTACRFLLRFYMQKSVKDIAPIDLAPSCIFLACKCEEIHLTLQKLILHTSRIRSRSEDFPDGEEVTPVHEQYFDEKERILKGERDILRELNFDLSVELPVRLLYDLVIIFHPKNSSTARALFQIGYGILNDSYTIRRLHLCYRSSEIATAVYYIAAKGSNVENLVLEDGYRRDADGSRYKAWFEFYKCDVHRVRECCDLILDMYEAEGVLSIDFEKR